MQPGEISRYDDADEEDGRNEDIRPIAAKLDAKVKMSICLHYGPGQEENGIEAGKVAR